MKIKIIILLLFTMSFSFQSYSDDSVSEKESSEGCVKGCECINDSPRNEEGKLVGEEDSSDSGSSGGTKNK